MDNEKVKDRLARRVIGLAETEAVIRITTQDHPSPWNFEVGFTAFSIRQTRHSVNCSKSWGTVFLRRNLVTSIC